ncbi:hypothetical protein [Mycobacterium lepromatosis]|nr:hypothetical protein [Mycobacterium lepromatosis]
MAELDGMGFLDVETACATQKALRLLCRTVTGNFRLGVRDSP